jgi:hypothetical protein
MADLDPSTDENGRATMILGLTKAAFKSFPRLRISLDMLDHKKKNIIGVQWFVAIATAYLLLFRNGEVSQEPLPYLLLALILGAPWSSSGSPIPFLTAPCFAKP